MHIYACIFSVSITPFNRRKITEGLMRELKKIMIPRVCAVIEMCNCILNIISSLIAQPSLINAIT